MEIKVLVIRIPNTLLFIQSGFMQQRTSSCPTVLKRLYEVNKESVDDAVRRRLQKEQYEMGKQVL